MKTTIRLSFADSDEIDAKELADFLFLFGAIYTVGTVLAVARPTLAEADEFEQAVVSHVRRLSFGGLSPLFHQELGVWKLVPKYIGKQSPFAIEFEGLAAALTVAVIFSGGKINLAGVLQATLPPLSEGIKKLRDVLSPSPKVIFSYGPQIQTIKLSKSEFMELMHHSGRGQGGFQILLSSLQKKVKRGKRELTLTGDELDRLFRYAQNPKKGGWQASIHKIFGRHFRF